MKEKGILEIARSIETEARNIRTLMLRTEPEKQGEIQTLRYCGALLSLVSSTLCELHEQLHPVFSADIVNGILREWGEEELMTE